MDNGEPIYAYTTPQKVSERTWSAESIEALYEQQKKDNQVPEPVSYTHLDVYKRQASSGVTGLRAGRQTSLRQQHR